MVRYAEYNRHYYTLVLTLRRGVPRVMRFLVGVVPIFLAYSVFAVVYFGDNVPRFGDLQTAMVRARS